MTKICAVVGFFKITAFDVKLENNCRGVINEDDQTVPVVKFSMHKTSVWVFLRKSRVLEDLNELGLHLEEGFTWEVPDAIHSVGVMTQLHNNQ